MCGIHVVRRGKKGSNFNRQKQVFMLTLRIRLFHVITRYKIITFCRARIQNQLRKVSRDNTTETFSQKYSEKLRGLYTLHVIAFHVKGFFIARKTNAKKQQRKIFAFGYSAWTIFSLWLPTLNCFRLRLLRIDYFQPMGTPSPSGLTINPHLKFKTHTFTEPIFLQTRLEIIAPECNVGGGGV